MTDLGLVTQLRYPATADQVNDKRDRQRRCTSVRANIANHNNTSPTNSPFAIYCSIRPSSRALLVIVPATEHPYLGFTRTWTQAPCRCLIGSSGVLIQPNSAAQPLSSGTSRRAQSTQLVYPSARQPRQTRQPRPQRAQLVALAWFTFTPLSLQQPSESFLAAVLDPSLELCQTLTLWSPIRAVGATHTSLPMHACTSLPLVAGAPFTRSGDCFGALSLLSTSVQQTSIERPNKSDYDYNYPLVPFPNNQTSLRLYDHFPPATSFPPNFVQTSSETGNSVLSNEPVRTSYVGDHPASINAHLPNASFPYYCAEHRNLVAERGSGLAVPSATPGTSSVVGFDPRAFLLPSVLDSITHCFPSHFGQVRPSYRG